MASRAACMAPRPYHPIGLHDTTATPPPCAPGHKVCNREFTHSVLPSPKLCKERTVIDCQEILKSKDSTQPHIRGGARDCKLSDSSGAWHRNEILSGLGSGFIRGHSDHMVTLLRSPLGARFHCIPMVGGTWLTVIMGGKSHLVQSYALLQKAARVQ